jgi:spore photoproduct lyase
VVELKTRTLNLDSVKSLGPHPNLVISWSLNAPYFAEIYEAKSPTIRQRVEAAFHLQQLGFRVGIHFDPLIYSVGWEDQYTKTLDLMRDKLGELAWISLGAFRGPPGLRRILEETDPRKTLLLEEFVRGKDGKMRYFRPIRVRMYRFMKERLASDFPGAPIYLCMESPEVWKSVFGWFPKNNKELGDWLVKTKIG